MAQLGQLSQLDHKAQCPTLLALRVALMILHIFTRLLIKGPSFDKLV